jgi:predicted small lipoprotein YifL
MSRNVRGTLLATAAATLSVVVAGCGQEGPPPAAVKPEASMAAAVLSGRDLPAGFLPAENQRVFEGLRPDDPDCARLLRLADVDESKDLGGGGDAPQAHAVFYRAQPVSSLAQHVFHLPPGLAAQHIEQARAAASKCPKMLVGAGGAGAETGDDDSDDQARDASTDARTDASTDENADELTVESPDGEGHGRHHHRRRHHRKHDDEEKAAKPAVGELRMRRTDVHRRKALKDALTIRYADQRDGVGVDVIMAAVGDDLLVVAAPGAFDSPDGAEVAEDVAAKAVTKLRAVHAGKVTMDDAEAPVPVHTGHRHKRHHRHHQDDDQE